MSDELIHRLRNDVKQPYPLMEEAAEEIERLRSLIIEWVDADDDPNDIDGVYHSTWLALRKAVGR
jgi:hypothetical protein